MSQNKQTNRDSDFEIEHTEIKTCEVCGNKNLFSVLNLGLQPLCDELIRIGDDRICNEYPIEILLCRKCLTAHQRFQISKLNLFSNSYHYRSRFTSDVLNGMSKLVLSTERIFGKLSGKKVLDIGCNDGSLLDFFRDHGAITIGVEPTGAYVDAEKKGHIIYNEYFSEKVAEHIVGADGIPDFITFTNVFAHINDLHEVIRSLKILLGKETVVIIENHYLGSILSENQFDTFYQEHLRTYSCKSFKYIARSLGVNLINVQFPSRYGGNIRVYLGDHPDQSIKPDEGDQESKNINEGHFIESFANLQRNVKNWRINKISLLQLYFNQYGKLRCKAFPARAAILSKLLKFSEDHILAVYEKSGSLKVGHYVPGTRIPILSDNDLFQGVNDSSPLLNLAWHIPNEIRSYLKQHNYVGEVIDILSPDEFTSL